MENIKVEGRLALHDHIDFGQHTRSNDGGHDMPSKSLDNTNGQTTSGMACYHDPWIGNTVRQRLVWHAFLALRLHTQKDDVGLAML